MSRFDAFKFNSEEERTKHFSSGETYEAEALNVKDEINENHHFHVTDKSRKRRCEESDLSYEFFLDLSFSLECREE